MIVIIIILIFIIDYKLIQFIIILNLFHNKRRKGYSVMILKNVEISRILRINSLLRN